MKSKEFIIERKIPDAEEIAHTYNLNSADLKMCFSILKDCQPFLNEVNNNPFKHKLFRGVSRDADTSWADVKQYIHKPIRLENRTPRDASQEFHDGLNKWMTTNFGAPFRNAMFCSGSKFQTHDYGDEYMIFPVGDFKFLWSPSIKDVWSEFAGPFRNHLRKNLEAQDPHTPFNNVNEIADDWFDNYFNGDYSNRNLKLAINSRKEVMIRAKSFYGIQFDDFPETKQIGFTEIFNLI